MKSSKNQLFWYTVFALCFIAFQLVQDTIRPGYSGDNTAIKYFWGIAPNFFPAVGIPALFYVVIPMIISSKKMSKWFGEKRHLTANILSLTGLLAWKFFQPLTKHGHFDWNDVVWTLIGALILQMIWMLAPQSFKAIEPE